MRNLTTPQIRVVYRSGSNLERPLVSGNNLDFSKFEGITTRPALRQALQYSPCPTLQEAGKLTALAAALTPKLRPMRLGIVHSYTSELLDPWLRLAATLEGIELDIYHAPYGLNLGEAELDSGLVKHAPDLTLFLLTRGDIHPALARPVVSKPLGEQESLVSEAADRLLSIVKSFRSRNIGYIVVTLLPAHAGPPLGLYDPQSQRSEASWWTALKTEIARRLSSAVQSSLLLDLDEVVAQVGRNVFFDSRLWYSARFPFSSAGAREVARRLVAVGAALRFPRIKVIALDADGTLWGGIIGEDGFHGIALGPDYPGSVYLAFQRRILDFRERGFLLALCSKNNPADVDQVLEKHPHQLLRSSHFAAIRVNWATKIENLVAIAEELNLGLDSFLFVDDSDHECELVRRELPDVEVVRIPQRAVDIPSCLDQISRLEVLSMTNEDLRKTEMYAEERARRQLQEQLSNCGYGLDDYLRSLQMKMVVRIDDLTQIARLAQLTQKTNQFNLTTRRYDEYAIRKMTEDPDWVVAHFSLQDSFGDSGVVGLAIVDLATLGLARLDSFLMSCRVIGRKAESCFLNVLLKQLMAMGVRGVEADYVPTPKNAVVAEFLPNQGFAAHTDGRWHRDLVTMPPAEDDTYPIAVELIGKAAAAELPV